MQRTILHADVNNFYASVAIRNNPELKNKPVVICGDPEKRHGIVLAKSNEAKKAGIKTGDTVFEASKKVKNLIVLPPDYKQYMKFSNIIYNIYKQYTPLVESFGLDECWLDVTGTEKLFGDGITVANTIRERIKNEVGLTISIGVSFTKIFAKLGSDIKKPDAVTVIDKDNYKRVAWALPVGDMLNIGRSIVAKLNKFNVFTIGELANTSPFVLNKAFGKVGEKLYEYANGLDNDEVGYYNSVHLPESVSNGSTTEVDIKNMHDAMSLIYSLSEIIAFRLRCYKLVASGVSLSVKNSNLESFVRQRKLVTPIDDSYNIAEEAIGLLKENYSFERDLPIRAITVGTYKLTPISCDVQMTMFDDEIVKNKLIDKQVDKLRSKYGYSILKRAIEISEHFSCDAREIEDGFLPFDKSKNEVDE